MNFDIVVIFFGLMFGINLVLCIWFCMLCLDIYWKEEFVMMIYFIGICDEWLVECCVLFDVEKVLMW